MGLKPLEWVECEDQSFEAESPLGSFCVYYDEGYGWLCLIDSSEDAWVRYPTEDYGFDTPEEAKAECDRHMRDAITPYLTQEGADR